MLSVTRGYRFWYRTQGVIVCSEGLQYLLLIRNVHSFLRRLHLVLARCRRCEQFCDGRRRFLVKWQRVVVLSDRTILVKDLVVCGEWDEGFANSRRREWAASDGRCRGAHPEWGGQADNGLCAYCRWRLANEFDLFGVNELCLVASSLLADLIVRLTFSLCLSFRYGVSVSELGCRGLEPSVERGGRGTTMLTLRHPLPRSKPSPSNR